MNQINLQNALDYLAFFSRYYLRVVADEEIAKQAWTQMPCHAFLENMVDEWEIAKRKAEGCGIQGLEQIDLLMKKTEAFWEELYDILESITSLDQYIQKVQTSPQWMEIVKEAKDLYQNLSILEMDKDAAYEYPPNIQVYPLDEFDYEKVKNQD